jgi:hypothetical protein
MLSRLDEMSRRFEMLTEQLTIPEIISNRDQFQKLSRERSGLEKVVASYSVFRKNYNDYEAARAMLSTEKDPELHSMAEAEISELEPQIVKQADELQVELLPKDPNDEKSRLYQPTNLAIDPQGRVSVSDSGGFCVKTYDSEGVYVKTLGDMGVRPGEFSLCKGIAADREGRLLVVDSAAAVVQMFDKDGRLLMYFGDPANSGEAGLWLPAAISVDYENTALFNEYVAPGYKLEYLILVTNQAGPHKVSVFGFLKAL